MRFVSGANLAFLGLVALLAAIPLAAPQFWVTLGNYIGLYSIVALGLVIAFPQIALWLPGTMTK